MLQDPSAHLWPSWHQSHISFSINDSTSPHFMPRDFLFNWKHPSINVTHAFFPVFLLKLLDLKPIKISHTKTCAYSLVWCYWNYHIIFFSLTIEIILFNLLSISIYSFVPMFRTFYILVNISRNFILKWIIDKELVNDVSTRTYCDCLLNCIQYKFKAHKGSSTCDQAIDIVENN